MIPAAFLSITISHYHSVRSAHRHQDYSPIADLSLAPTTILSLPPFISPYDASSIQPNLLPANIPTIQSTAEPSGSLLIITLITIRFIQVVIMQKPGRCGAFDNDTYSQLALMVS